MMAGFIQQAFDIGFARLYCILVLLGHLYAIVRDFLCSYRTEDHNVNEDKTQTHRLEPDKECLIMEV